MPTRKTIPIVGLADNDIQRFWSHVEKRGPDECWPWIGTIGSNGYGRFSIDGSSYQ